MTDAIATTTASQLWFTAPFEVEVRKFTLAAPGPGEVEVKTLFSAVSAGTELLLYRGQLPPSMSLDSTLESLQRPPQYPVPFGYACVGEVQKVGSGVDPAWIGTQVFSFQPHASHFIAQAQHLIALPTDISAQSAVFLPNMETAVNLVQDGQPMLGERVVVLGQGVVGLLLSGVLAQYPLASLSAVEAQPQRQRLALKMGAGTVCAPDEAALPEQRQPAQIDADLIYEVSGHPDALNLAIALAGYTSRIVIGSWYGNKSVSVDLGGSAHRNRLQLITSQVSTLAPSLGGRWDKQRRFDVAWEMIRRLDPSRLITHTVPLADAGDLYRRLHEQQSDIVQPLFHYPTS